VTSLTVDVVLPCLDEAAALPWVLARIPAGWRALVVDNGSRDGSPGVARSLGAHVVHEPRRGYGAACHAGLLAATADVVCFCDCDATLDPGLLAGFVRTLAAGEADLVLARRRPAARGAWPAHARAANLALSVLLRRRTGLRLHDLGPLRAAPRRALLDLALTDRRSGYPLQTVVRAADAGWRVREVDVPYLPREGASKVTGTWRGTWQAVRDMRRVLAEPPAAGGAAAPPAPSAAADGRARHDAGATAPGAVGPRGAAPRGDVPGVARAEELCRDAAAGAVRDGVSGVGPAGPGGGAGAGAFVRGARAAEACRDAAAGAVREGVPGVGPAGPRGGAGAGALVRGASVDRGDGAPGAEGAGPRAGTYRRDAGGRGAVGGGAV
jgi:hypothetical protein